MPTTPLGFVYGNETDAPDMVALDQAGLTSIDAWLIANGYAWATASGGYAAGVQVYLATRTLGNTLTANNTAPTMVSNYDGPSYSKGSRITFGSGVITVADAGLYKTYCAVGFSIGTGDCWVQVFRNGSTNSEVNGRDFRSLTGSHTRQVSVEGWHICAAGDTFQMGVQSPDGALANVNPFSFGMRRIG